MNPEPPVTRTVFMDLYSDGSAGRQEARLDASSGHKCPRHAALPARSPIAVIDHKSVPDCDGLEIAASLLGEEFEMKVQPGIKISAAALFASCALMFAPVKAAIQQTPTQTTTQSPTPTIANTEAQEEIKEAVEMDAQEAQGE